MSAGQPATQAGTGAADAQAAGPVASAGEAGGLPGELAAGPPGRAWRRGALIAAGVAAAAAAAAGTTAGLAARHPARAAAASPLPTARVVRTNLIDRQLADGTLGYAGPVTVAGHGGILTWLPAAGAVIRRGHAVYAADGVPVPLLYGMTPFWRTLQPGVQGPDVSELQRNLAALGYTVPVDGVFGWQTELAVEQWHTDLGVAHTATGQPAPASDAVQPGEVVIAPGALRVASLAGTLGGPAAGAVLHATSTARVVTVQLPVDEEQLATQGEQVTVQLPGGVVTSGRVTGIGTVASVPSSGSGQAGAGHAQPGQAVQNATVEVDVTLDRPHAARLDGAPATVGFTSAEHKGVLAVPVTALLALGPDSYAVRIAGPGGYWRTVPVRLGLFTSGDVEVAGPGLAPGQRVEVASS